MREDDKDAEQRLERLRVQERAERRGQLAILGGGVVLLVLFAVLAWFGYPGWGVLLVPIGLGMIIGMAIEMLFKRD